ncbi:hypothetical protein PFUGPA_03294 [Plasmodium falciparum Palo Alto/Uganda]|uniref:Uncharacterized protein n=1 Tax=Plasmodium falciparum (isolate Palo Alto / Uganda) TaxID=57270 RepID=W4IXH7_PLAFP|nr:hypothetical protein PFUGPA_03294 [Plasmodium falciparum Palo Alto/Uganda]
MCVCFFFFFYKLGKEVYNIHIYIFLCSSYNIYIYIYICIHFNFKNKFNIFTFL